MSIEGILTEIAASLKTIAEKVGAAPVKKTRASAKKKDEIPATSTEGSLDGDLGDSAAETKSFSEQDLRDAAAPLVKVSGEGNKDGYNAAQKIILKYGASLTEVPEASRGTVIAELKAAFENWGGGLGGL